MAEPSSAKVRALGGFVLQFVIQRHPSSWPDLMPVNRVDKSRWYRFSSCVVSSRDQNGRAVSLLLKSLRAGSAAPSVQATRENAPAI
jgi:hypothetical protein